MTAFLEAFAAAVAELGARAVVGALVDALGADELRGHLDAWEAARHASDEAFAGKFGEQP